VAAAAAAAAAVVALAAVLAGALEAAFAVMAVVAVNVMMMEGYSRWWWGLFMFMIFIVNLQVPFNCAEGSTGTHQYWWQFYTYLCQVYQDWQKVEPKISVFSKQLAFCKHKINSGTNPIIFAMPASAKIPNTYLHKMCEIKPMPLWGHV
jgi:hypothetical protein